MNEVPAQSLRRKLQPVRSLMGRALRAVGIKRSSNSYNIFATHLPVLVGLARIFNLRRIVEFGCGQYSTLTFLDQNAFPSLETLRSYETDPDWTQKVRELAGPDTRFEISTTDGAMPQVIPDVPFADYDLIFVDDSLTYEERAETIKAIARHCHPSNLVVIHDYDSPLYQSAAISFRHRFAFTALTPQTGLVWNDFPVDVAQLESLNTLIKRYSRRYKPDDLAGWRQLIHQRISKGEDF